MCKIIRGIGEVHYWTSFKLFRVEWLRQREHIAEDFRIARKDALVDAKSNAFCNQNHISVIEPYRSSRILWCDTLGVGVAMN